MVTITVNHKVLSTIKVTQERTVVMSPRIMRRSQINNPIRCTRSHHWIKSNRPSLILIKNKKSMVLTYSIHKL